MREDFRKEIFFGENERRKLEEDRENRDDLEEWGIFKWREVEVFLK